MAGPIEQADEPIEPHRSGQRCSSISEHQLTKVLDTLTEGVALWDGDGVLRYANPAMRGLGSAACLRVGTTQFARFAGQLTGSDGRRPAFAPGDVWQTALAGGLAKGRVVRLDGRHGRRRWLSFTAVPVSTGGDTGGAALVSSVTDITELKDRSESMARLAHFDLLTGLPNRRLLEDRMRQMLPQHRRSGRQLALCYLDLDGFKAVNDRFGHEVGDELLKQAAQRLSAEIRAGDTLARLGGDEFVVLLGDLHDGRDCLPVVQRMLRALAAAYRIAGSDVGGVSASIGITLSPADDSDPDALLRHADQAMYRAKHAGKNTFKWFNPAHEQRIEAQQPTLVELRQALHDGDLVLHYQPVVNCRRGVVVGAEALIRWQHPVLGLLPPTRFLPLVEDNDLAIEIGGFVIAQALRQSCAWRRAGHQLTIGVNLFTRQLRQPQFATNLREQIRRFGCHRSPGLDFEISESAALEEVNGIGGLLSRCRDNGVNFALDGFGTGDSTLDHLRRVPGVALKIDRALIRGLLTDAEHRTLVGAIIGLGRSFDRQVIAAGVEELEQVRWLLAAGCEEMQGYHFARPMAAQQLLGWVQRFRPLPAWASTATADDGQDSASSAGA